MTTLQYKLIELFRKYKKSELIQPFREIKKDILSRSDECLKHEYGVHIKDLVFYGQLNN